MEKLTYQELKCLQRIALMAIEKKRTDIVLSAEQLAGIQWYVIEPHLKKFGKTITDGNIVFYDLEAVHNLINRTSELINERETQHRLINAQLRSANAAWISAISAALSFLLALVAILIQFC